MKNVGAFLFLLIYVFKHLTYRQDLHIKKNQQK